MKVSSSVFVAVFCLLSVAGCKKDDNPAASNNSNNTNCNFTTNVVVAGGVSSNVVQTNNNALGAGYIVEFLTDTSAAPTGVALVFSGGTSPAAGDYAMQADVSQLTTGQVYVEYYDPATAWHGTTGTVKVTASGSQKIATFCNIELTATPTNKKTVSIRGTFN
jgi:hypothetical protein